MGAIEANEFNKIPVGKLICLVYNNFAQEEFEFSGNSRGKGSTFEAAS